MRRTIFVSMVMVVICSLNQLTVAQTQSPGGFTPPQCTWFCDVFTSYYGWTLKFSSTSGRDAKNWAALITNAQNVGRPTSWSIMVLGPGINPDVSEGHVAIVTTVNASTGRICVWHSNYPYGTTIGTVSGVPIVETWFEPVPNKPGWIRRVGGGQQWPVKAYLLPRW